MKKYFCLLTLLFSSASFGAVDKSGNINSVQIWGGIAKTSVCSSESSCTSFWVSLSDAQGRSVLSMWLLAKTAGNSVYIQGYDPDNDSHPYNGASKFYGMKLVN